jgi:hypothetical protein
MAYPTDQEIRERAYQLWEKLGRPDGRGDELDARGAKSALMQDMIAYG